MNKRPRIMHVIESLEHGGAERVVLELANRQCQQLAVTVVCLKRQGELFEGLDSAIDTFCLRRPEGNSLVTLWQLARLVRRQRIDIVHSHAWGVYLDAGIAAILGGAPGLLHTAHGPYPEPRPGRLGLLKTALRRTLERWLSSRTYRIVTVSDSVGEVLRTRLGFEADKIETIHNGVGEAPPACSEPSARNGRVRLISVGRLAEIKNHGAMLDAVARLAPRFPGLELQLVGDGPERSALERHAEHLGIAEGVEFLGFRDDVTALLSKADVFVLTSWHEGISIALLEAMRAALPVIATAVGGVPETVVDGMSGVLVKPGDVEGLVGAIELLVMSGGERRRLGDNARQRVQECFSSGAMVRQYGTLYRQALGASRPLVSAPALEPVRPRGSAAKAARPLRILYHHRTQGRGAEGVHIASIVREFEALGHQVTLVSPAGIDPLTTAGEAPVDKAEVAARGVEALWKAASRRLPGWLFELGEIAYNAVAWWPLRRALAKGQFDMVYERYAFYLLAGALQAKRHGIPFVLEANEVSGLSERARRQSFPRLCAAFERFLLRRCGAVMTVSSHLRDLLLDQGIEPERVHVVPNAIDDRALRPLSRRPDLVARYGLEGRTVMGFAGWFDHWDRLDLLIGALARLKPWYPRLAVLLIGDGPSLSKAREKAKACGLQDDVVMCGAVDRDEIHDHLALLDIAVLPHSNRFGSPVVMFEFMARSVPIVAPRLTPIQDVLDDDHSALLFDPLDADGLVVALSRYLDSARLRHKLAAQAYDVLIQQHTWRRNAERSLQVVGLGAAVEQEELRRAG